MKRKDVLPHEGRRSERMRRHIRHDDSDGNNSTSCGAQVLLLSFALPFRVVEADSEGAGTSPPLSHNVQDLERRPEGPQELPGGSDASKAFALLRHFLATACNNQVNGTPAGCFSTANHRARSFAQFHACSLRQRCSKTPTSHTH